MITTAQAQVDLLDAFEEAKADGARKEILALNTEGVERWGADWEAKAEAARTPWDED